jgi:hypothetical protein
MPVARPIDGRRFSGYGWAMSDAAISREAISVNRDCGTECDPKAFAFAQSGLFSAHGNCDEAIRWAEIAIVIDELLQDVTRPESIPKALH